MGGLQRPAGPLSRTLTTRMLGGLVIAGLLLTLLLGGVVRRFVATARPLSSPLAESTMVCFGITARLALVRTEDRAVAAPTAMVRNAHWRLALDVPADFLAVEEMKVSLDAFPIRGNQAVRDDLVAPRSSGQAWPLATEGVVHLPAPPGGIQDRDQGRILAWIQTARGSFGVPGIIFGLTVHPEGLNAVNPLAVPVKPCPVPPSPSRAPTTRSGTGAGHRGYGSRLHTKHLPSPKSAKSSSGSAPGARSSASVPM